MHKHKLLSRSRLLTCRAEWKRHDQRLVFTNGCFDVLHRGHVEYLQQARALGDLLLVGLNSDASVARVKGPGRPLVPQEDRAALLCALQDVDFLTIFPETSVEPLVREILPDVLVKGGDYDVADVVGREIVEASGGRVQTLCHVPGRSTTDLGSRLIKD
ncbi:MAG TPA: D-glycero-beta-D-manno-heptose 1-phosphate adenylyltransferase [Candidatus Latescibacteria bacterium]|jgi:D-beta-D-heptose 7-phosphate kinase/D-beta-D-heptose 1-phosphate adenosyltransferase|nr:D-glycero-beta-D-manno-heptose 1-phosphate adenylyltransferase [Gemmatimonadaceae bacterium]MDP6015761.1 D-glycero-beta-D-manno-heptose 1-phosphate adenylyltransferase [Candidatus Latescibacterota bacterium]HJP30091.1 D-glycero-beta-D-manno-heptose 1-phosphate adenylyltransferase [Candidatus Latescibacterota bacterium]|tara:strand:+ start:372 stop:848 length:477 start_codon:yes stop_codon:yes gene_type:complete